MSRWLHPLTASIFKDAEGNADWFAKTDWFPSNAVVVGIARGSMDISTMPLFLQHFQQHVRKLVPADKQVCLTIDRHSSRNGREWLEACDTLKISAVQLPAHKTHFLQPNDDLVNKPFKVGMRHLRDGILRRTLVDFGDMQLKFMLAVAGYGAITTDTARTAFRNVGLWPMDYHFVHVDENRTTPPNPSGTPEGVS